MRFFFNYLRKSFFFMRIAFYFSGRILTFHEQIRYLKRIQEINEADFFLSANSFMDYYHEYFIKFFDVKSWHVSPFALDDSHPSFVKILQTFGYGALSYVSNSFSMFYNKKKCMELIKKYEQENNFKYDIICSFRADIQSNKDFIMPSEIENNAVYVPPDDFDEICDQIGYGDHDAMEKYSNAYDYVLENGKNFVYKGRMPGPEYWLRTTLDHENVKIIKFNYDYQLNPRRRFAKNDEMKKELMDLISKKILPKIS